MILKSVDALQSRRQRLAGICKTRDPPYLPALAAPLDTASVGSFATGVIDVLELPVVVKFLRSCVAAAAADLPKSPAGVMTTDVCQDCAAGKLVRSHSRTFSETMSSLGTSRERGG